MGLILSLSTCSLKADSKKAVDDPNRPVEQLRKDGDKTVEDANKAADEVANSRKNGNDCAQDAISSGGQPGTISLDGPPVTISSVKFSGNGKIENNAEGSNYPVETK
ncbi:MAG: hypothetical protein IPJ71_10945 [Bdellovibrionales bacterium]|nr:hypothetical protein [Bdellovibrionales bacterium]